MIYEIMNILSSIDEPKVVILDDELIWREFIMQLMYHFPYIAYEPFARDKTFRGKIILNGIQYGVMEKLISF